MLSCKQVTRLASEKRDRSLSLRERLSFRMHLMMCAACSRFDAQMQFMRTAMSRFSRGETPDREDR
ncbi:zf-HC2 domain-containing protein [Denitromonas halophila]|uniref:Zf-HC2 domain-containing protein n=1 Tax=Denitromonas halophila TaxID=1629404 RepID=A0A557QXW8_9RHOO|nr:zf-HC2 domain-containing protein [Denitromonas halophila]TVO57755.1 zf-HC2 domain-containing protein [Denitromonas halophila]